MMNSKKTLAILSVLILGLGFTLAVMMYKKSQKTETAEMAQTHSDVFVRDYAMTQGPDDAKVVLVEFMDPECESCKEFSPYVKMIMSEFDGKVKLVIRYALFHPNAMMMAKILEASRRQNKYWEVLEVLFKYQPQWGSHHEPKPELVWGFLSEAGVNIDQIKTDMNDPVIQANIDQDQADVAKLGIRYTPTFYVNGKPLEDFGVEQLKTMIRTEIDK